MNRIFLINLSIIGLFAFSACGVNEPSEMAASAEVAVDPGAALPIMGPAPDWTLMQIDGTPLHFSELAGKVVVVDFWATWCGPCRVEIPGYIEMQKALVDEGLVIVGVSLDEKGVSVVKAFSERNGVNYPMVMGTPEVVAAFGGINVIPTTFLIDRDGNLRHLKKGAMARADYEPLVRSLL